MQRALHFVLAMSATVKLVEPIRNRAITAEFSQIYG